MEKWWHRYNNPVTDHQDNYFWLRNMIATAHGLRYIIMKEKKTGRVSKSDIFEYPDSD